MITIKEGAKNSNSAIIGRVKRFIAAGNTMNANRLAIAKTVQKTAALMSSGRGLNLELAIRFIRLAGWAAVRQSRQRVHVPKASETRMTQRTASRKAAASEQ